MNPATLRVLARAAGPATSVARCKGGSGRQQHCRWHIRTKLSILTSSTKRIKSLLENIVRRTRTSVDAPALANLQTHGRSSLSRLDC